MKCPLSWGILIKTWGRLACVMTNKANGPVKVRFCSVSPSHTCLDGLIWALLEATKIAPLTSRKDLFSDSLGGSAFNDESYQESGQRYDGGGRAYAVFRKTASQSKPHLLVDREPHKDTRQPAACSCKAWHMAPAARVVSLYQLLAATGGSL